jgi:hypothetical protein
MSDEITVCNKKLYIIYNQLVNYNEYIMIRTNECSPYQIIIKDTSIYIININCQFDEPCTVGFYINEIEYACYETGVFNNLLIHQLLKLNVDDLITIKYLSDYPNKIVGSDNEINLWKFDLV